MHAGVLLLGLILVHVLALTESKERVKERRNNSKQVTELEDEEAGMETERSFELTEQLFFLLAPIGDSLIRMGAIFFAFAKAFFFSGTRGLLLRFL